MNIRKLLIFLVLTKLFLCGCMPCPRAITPAVKGTVVDKSTRKPITGAQVSIYEEFAEYDRLGKNRIVEFKKVKTSRTDGSGNFSVKEHVGLGFILFIGDPIPPMGLLEVKKDGYVNYSENVVADYFYSVEPIEKAVNLTVELEPVKKDDNLYDANR